MGLEDIIDDCILLSHQKVERSIDHLRDFGTALKQLRMSQAGKRFQLFHAASLLRLEIATSERSTSSWKCCTAKSCITVTWTWHGRFNHTQPRPASALSTYMPQYRLGRLFATPLTTYDVSLTSQRSTCCTFRKKEKKMAGCNSYLPRQRG